MISVKTLDSDRQSDHKFCIFTRGGLGDTIKRYFGEDTHGDGWEYLTPLKEKYPDAIIKLVTFSANSQTPHFHKYHPLIDEIYQHKWKDPRFPCLAINSIKGHDYQLIKLAEKNEINFQTIEGLVPIKQDTLYYSKEDQNFIEHMSYIGPYVVLHPFAGEHNRMVLPIKAYFPLVREILNRNLSVIVVGANWHKPVTYYPKHDVTEKFDFKIPGLINLIDRANPRIVAGLVMNSVCLISVRSYCFSLTKSGKVNSILLVSHPDSKIKAYLTPTKTRHNLLDPRFGWDEETINNKIKIIGVDNKYSETRHSILTHLDKILEKDCNAQISS